MPLSAGAEGRKGQGKGRLPCHRWKASAVTCTSLGGLLWSPLYVSPQPVTVLSRHVLSFWHKAALTTDSMNNIKFKS